MIRFEHVSKGFWVGDSYKTVIDDLDMELPTGKSLALLGRNGAGKSTLIQMIAGNVPVTSGRIVVDGSMSWPVAFGGSFHGQLTGVQNVRFVARIYGVDTDSLVRFVEDFAELGKHFRMPVRTYSAGMKSRLAFGTSMGIDFDTYLVDEVTAVGDAVFKRKSREVFKSRMERSGAILVSHSMNDVRDFCDAGVVLENGKLTYFEDLEEAIDLHQALMR
ncbi:ABC transporter ATP-binding protein [Pseudooceanicola sp. LIPI14-2-Ac024]|uniref:ABC transporter ATP-binding protein n=1 Tax=Pseudooceanicola sp. LIPI14-2-Ac024 TaxID=3344875 RepID=UPI0035D114A5